MARRTSEVGGPLDLLPKVANSERVLPNERCCSQRHRGALCNYAALRAAPFTANLLEPLQQNAALGGSPKSSMIRFSLLVLLFIIGLGPRALTAQSSVVDSVGGPFPSWDWRRSDRLLLAPAGQCGPTITPPGILVEAHLLAWTSRPLVTPGTRVYQALWWGRYRAVSGDSVWALARGYHHPPSTSGSDRDTTWSLSYVCDIRSHPFALFPKAPTAEQLRVFSQGFVGASVNQPVLEVGIRRATLQQLTGDSLAIGGPLFRIPRPLDP